MTKTQLKKEYEFTESPTGLKKDRAVLRTLFFIKRREDLKLLCPKKNTF